MVFTKGEHGMEFGIELGWPWDGAEIELGSGWDGVWNEIGTDLRWGL